MTDILLIILAVSQVFILYIFGMPIACQVLTHLGLKKNPQWIKDHPKFVNYKIMDILTRGFSYILAAGAVLAIVKYVIITPTPEYYMDLATVPLVISGVAFILYLILLQVSIINKIPAPEMTTASLSDRRLSSYVPMWVVYFGFACIAVIVGTYGWGFASGIIEMELTSRRMIGLGGGMMLWFGLTLYMLRRKYSEFDVIFGPDGRKYEIWGTVGMLYMFVLIGVWRISGDFFGINLFSDNAFFIITGFAFQIFILIYSFHPRVREILRDYKRILT